MRTTRCGRRELHLHSTRLTSLLPAPRRNSGRACLHSPTRSGSRLGPATQEPHRQAFPLPKWDIQGRIRPHLAPGIDLHPAYRRRARRLLHRRKGQAAGSDGPAVALRVWRSLESARYRAQGCHDCMEHLSQQTTGYCWRTLIHGLQADTRPLLTGRMVAALTLADLGASRLFKSSSRQSRQDGKRKSPRLCLEVCHVHSTCAY